jgi:hypothetical protein
MVSTELILVVTTIGYVLILPWTLKFAGNWDKVKKWYNFLIAGVLIGFGAFGFRIYGYATENLMVGQPIFLALQLIFQTIACALGGIGLIGMAKELVFKKK